MIRALTLQNFMCFRGTHTLHFESKAYAFTASFENDRDHSNTGGKSALFESIQFIITGRFNKDRRFDADGWITWGEKSGSGQIVFEDGAIITRSRIRGKSTQLSFHAPDGEESIQEAAQTRIYKYLCFDADDFSNVGYFAQGMMARIIRTEAEKRFDVVRGWLGLSKIEEAENVAAAKAAKSIKGLQELRSKVRTLHEMFKTTEVLLTEDLTNLEDAAKAIRTASEFVKKRTEKENLISRFEKLIFDGKELDHQISNLGPVDELRNERQKLQKKLEATIGRREVSQALVRDRKKVALGLFDGQCPVVDIQCPAKAMINNNRGASKIAAEEAQHRFDSDSKEYDELRQLLTQTDQVIVKADRLSMLRNQYKEEAAEMRDDVIEARRFLKAYRAAPQPTVDVDDWEARLKSAESKIIDHRSNQKQLERIKEDLEKYQAELEEASTAAMIATQARQVFRATQRRIAESTLQRIGDRANSLIAHANVDLRVDIQWEREGKDLARTCEMCGAPFPHSTKIRKCETCGAERGQNIVHRLEFIPSARSGAADDFTGIAMQLSAGSWLLSQRKSPWATGMLDEPFGQMDRTIRRAAAHQLSALLGSSSYRQIFVISHSQETVDSYSSRIHITVHKNGDRSIEVI